MIFKTTKARINLAKPIPDEYIAGSISSEALH
jgi:hypothetical protein